MSSILGFTGQYRWLSNFHVQRIEYEGLTYSSTEAAYQAAKLPPDQRLPFTRYLPGQAKRAAPKVVAGWKQRRVPVMRAVTAIKYSPAAIESRWLLDTGDAELVEVNSWNDRFWGVCDGEGLNTLGVLIMERRAEIRRLITAGDWVWRV